MYSRWFVDSTCSSLFALPRLLQRSGHSALTGSPVSPPGRVGYCEDRQSGPSCSQCRIFYPKGYFTSCRSRWPRGLAWVCGLLLACWHCGFESRLGHGCLSCECCVLSGRGLCVGLIPRPEESYRVWCVWVWWWSLGNEEALPH